ncbi:MAG: acetyl-CoA carboxylase biotin carboxyl carrier protein [Chlamydiales bacterium]
MELKQIKELMALMEKSGVRKLFIKEKTGAEIEIERQDEQPQIQLPPGPSYPFYAGAPLQQQDQTSATGPTPDAVKKQDLSKQKEEGKYVLSPMVGTFYGSPSPSDPVFVKVGDRVEENSVVCIIEAMKVMNEVKAGVRGTVAEVLVDNAHPVEFGTKLFRIV